MMHVILISCAMTYESNRSRESAVFDPLDPHHPSHGGVAYETTNALITQQGSSSSSGAKNAKF